MGVQTILGEESETSRSEILSQRDSKQRTQPTAFRLMSPRGKMSHYVARDRRFCRLLACCFWLFQQRFYYFDPLCFYMTVIHRLVLHTVLVTGSVLAMYNPAPAYFLF